MGSRKSRKFNENYPEDEGPAISEPGTKEDQRPHSDVPWNPVHADLYTNKQDPLSTFDSA